MILSKRFGENAYIPSFELAGNFARFETGRPYHHRFTAFRLRPDVFI